MFGWREIHSDALDAKGIRYRLKIKNSFSDISRQMGTADVDMNYAFQYYLYVKTKDVEQARLFAASAQRI